LLFDKGLTNIQTLKVNKAITFFDLGILKIMLMIFLPIFAGVCLPNFHGILERHQEEDAEVEDSWLDLLAAATEEEPDLDAEGSDDCE